MRRVTPLGALARGLLAGAVGAAALDGFFRLTRRIAPKMPEGAYRGPDLEQAAEPATETAARRLVEGLARRGPLSEERKHQLGQVVHYSFGSAWGGLYGLLRETHVVFRHPAMTAGFATTVWAVSDELVVPALRLSGWAKHYPVKVHAYAWAAHLVYGATLAAVYEALRPTTWAAAGTALWALSRRRRLARRLPKVARPIAAPTVNALAALKRTAERVRSIPRQPE